MERNRRWWPRGAHGVARTRSSTGPPAVRTTPRRTCITAVASLAGSRCRSNVACICSFTLAAVSSRNGASRYRAANWRSFVASMRSRTACRSAGSSQGAQRPACFHSSCQRCCRSRARRTCSAKNARVVAGSRPSDRARAATCCRTMASRSASRIGAPDSHLAAATSRMIDSRSSIACTRDCAAFASANTADGAATALGAAAVAVAAVDAAGGTAGVAAQPEIAPPATSTASKAKPMPLE